MEHINRHQGGKSPHTQFHEQQPPQPQGQDRPTDEQLIYHGITEALREDRSIDHATARALASQLHGGQDSPLYALTSSGALVDGLHAELDTWRTEAPVELEPWLDALDEYIEQRDDAGPVDGWHELWPTAPDREDEEPAAGDEERPPYGTSACAIGRPAVSVTVRLGQGEGHLVTAQATDDSHEDDEPDPFPWTDAATWSSTEVVRANVESRSYTPDELNDLFDEPVDDEIGSVDELGWFGRVKHEAASC